MSGMFRVSLRKRPSVLSCCGGTSTPSTGPAGTVHDNQHGRWCRVGRVIALAAGPRPSWFEPLPTDDKHSPRSRYGGAA
jgi:hypothetical protein